MEIVLVDSIDFSKPTTEIQLGLLSLNNLLIKEFQVEIFDFDRMHHIGSFVYDNDIDTTILKIADYLANRNAQIYGFYTVCHSYPITILTAKRLKQIHSSATIILGGPHASSTAVETLKAFEYIDAIAIGES